jgi:thymidylate synthase
MKAASTLLRRPDFMVSPRGCTIQELMNVSMIIEEPLECIFENSARSTPEEYLRGEILWYLSGRNDLAFIQQYSKFWNRIANADGTCNSAYGNLLFNLKPNAKQTEWKWALDSLLQDHDTRQAVIHFNEPSHAIPGTRDFVCTMYGNFHIRNNKLHFKVSMRSNDIKRGTTFDIPFFCLLQYMMLIQLREKYSQLELGTFTHCVDSLHIYSADIPEMEQMIHQPTKSKLLPVFLPENCPIGMDGKPKQFMVDLAQSVMLKNVVNTLVYTDPFYRWLIYG